MEQVNLLNKLGISYFNLFNIFLFVVLSCAFFVGANMTIKNNETNISVNESLANIDEIIENNSVNESNENADADGFVLETQNDDSQNFDFETQGEINPSLETGLILLWHFNNDSSVGESDTQVYDWTGNGYNISGSENITNLTLTSAGKLGGAFIYNSSGFMSVGRIRAVENLTSFTVSLWMKAEVANAGSQYMISKKRSGFRGWEIVRASTEAFSFSISNASNSVVVSTTTTYIDTDWHHVVSTWNGTHARIYVDGVNASGLTELIGPMGTQGGDNGYYLCMGTASTNTVCSSTGSFNGTLDEIAMWNRSLSSDEILALYQQGNSQAIVWNCTAGINSFDNPGCWNLGRVPKANDDVVFNGTGLGNVNVTNNTMPQNLNSFTVAQSYNGTIHFNPMFANGSWGSNAVGTQAWNVTGNITVLNGTVKIYGDYLLAPFGIYNLTAEGHGQIWRSKQSNITVGAAAKIDGTGLGFTDYCCGRSNSVGGGGAASHGGWGGPSDATEVDLYGNATAPTSLGSGGSSTANINRGGSAIKLQADSGTILIDGVINMSAIRTTNDAGGGSGGSIWLYANNISGSGHIVAEGMTQVSGTSDGGGGGGRIKFDFNSLSYRGVVSVAGGKGTTDGAGGLGGGTSLEESVINGRAGTYAFSSPLGTLNNFTYPSSWTLNGSVGLEGGNYTILGDLVIPEGTVLSTGPYINYTYNTNATPVFLNVLGNISILGKIDGYRGGYLSGRGPGADTVFVGTTAGSSYGGRGGKGNGGIVYGNEIYPIDAGSGSGSRDTGSSQMGGGAIKLVSGGFIEVNGTISVNGNNASIRGSSAGGSILLIAGTEIKGNGTLTGRALDAATNLGGGGGGRIALHARDINFRGDIDVRGSVSATPEYSGSGGTVYINSTRLVNLTGNIYAFGKNGSSNLDNGQRINISTAKLITSGLFNATTYNFANTINGTITLDYSYCVGTSVGGSFYPNVINNGVDGGCIVPQVNFTGNTPTNGSTQTLSSISANITSSDNSGTHYTFTDFDRSLLGWWTMDNINSSGSIIDSSTYNHNGNAIGNALQNETGRFGRSFSFDGTGDYVRLSSNPITNFSVSNSICLWMYAASPSVNQRALNLYIDDNNYVNLGVVGGGDGFFVGYEAGGTAYGRSRQVALSSNTWTHGCYVFNGTGIALYVDGSLVTSTVGNGLSAASGNVIGNRGTVGTAFWNGSIDDVLIFNRTLSQAEINSLYNASATQYYNTFNSLETRTDFAYTLKGYTVDTAGNINSTETRHFYVQLDASPPTVNITYPLNTTYSSLVSALNYTVNDASGVSACWYSLDSGATNTSLVCGTNLTGLSSVQGTNIWTIYSNDTWGNTNGTSITFFVDTIRPSIQLVAPTESNNSLLGRNWILANITANDTNLQNITVMLRNVTHIVNTSIVAASQAYLNFTGLNDGIYYLNATATDSALNTNATETRVINLDTNGPGFVSLSASISDEADLDPFVNLTITANVSDPNGRLNIALLQWKNATSAIWNNITMDNQSVLSGSYIIMNASLPLPAYQTNVTYRIFANDSIGNNNLSTNATLVSYWDCTWTVTSDIGQAAGFGTNENGFVGTLSINNTGDKAYASNNCTLQFRQTYNLIEGRVFMDNSYFKPSDTYTIAAKANRSVSINATFRDEVTEESVYLTTTELLGLTNSPELNTTFTLVSTTGGPYLFQTISSAPTSAYLTPGDFILDSFVRNLVGDGNANNTAFNVTSNWTLPEGFDVSNGNITAEYSNLSSNNAHRNNVTVSFSSSNIPSLVPGIHTITLYSQGFNQSGGVIVHSGNRTFLTNTATINLLCYNVSDGISVAACGSLDGDYVESSSGGSSSGSSSTSSGSSGGGGGGSSGTTVLSRAEYQFTRGKESKISFVLFNSDYNSSLSDINVQIQGAIARYINVSPYYGAIGPRRNVTLDLIITSPTYIPLGLQALTLQITGKLGTNSYIEQRRIAIQVNDIDSREAQAIYDESVALMMQFRENNFSSETLEIMLNEQSTHLSELDYASLQQKASIIKENVNNALEARRIYLDISSLVENANEKGIDVSGTERLLRLTELSLERQEFGEAVLRANQAQISYALETKGELGNLIYYVRNNPQELSLAAAFLALFSFTAAKTVQLLRLRRKINGLREEEIILVDLIKVVQRQTFKEKTMSMKEYEEAMKHYETRLSHVIESLIQLETKRLHWLKFSTEDKRLRTERQKVVELIKQLQYDYLKKGKIETKSYELRLESYNRRISQIDESLANLEVKQSLRKLRIFR